MLDDNISEIKKLMANEPKPVTPKGTKSQEDQGLSKLLDLLEKERRQADEPPKKNTSSTTKAPQAE